MIENLRRPASPLTSDEVLSEQSCDETPAQHPYGPFFNIKLRHYIGDAAVNFDKIGIVYQYGETFFVVFEVKINERSTRVHGDTFHGSKIGNYLHHEWAILPKMYTGQFCIGASQSDQPNWVHSQVLGKLRLQCTTIAQRFESVRKERNSTEANFAEVLQRRLLQQVDKYYARLEAEERREIMEAQGLWWTFCYDPIDPSPRRVI